MNNNAFNESTDLEFTVPTPHEHNAGDTGVGSEDVPFEFLNTPGASAYSSALSAGRDVAQGTLHLDGDYHYDELMHLMINKFGLSECKAGNGTIMRIKYAEDKHSYVEPKMRQTTVTAITTQAVGLTFKSIRQPLSVLGKHLNMEGNSWTIDGSPIDFDSGFITRIGGHSVLKGGPTITPDPVTPLILERYSDFEKNVKPATSLASVGWTSPVPEISQIHVAMKNNKVSTPKMKVKFSEDKLASRNEAFEKSMTTAFGGLEDYLKPVQSLKEAQQRCKQLHTVLMECRKYRGSDNGDAQLAEWGLFPGVPRKLAVWRQALFFRKIFDSSVRVNSNSAEFIESLGIGANGKHLIVYEPSVRPSTFEKTNTVALQVPEIFDYFVTTMGKDPTKLLDKDTDLRASCKTALCVTVPTDTDGVIILNRMFASGWCWMPGTHVHNGHFWMVYGVQGFDFPSLTVYIKTGIVVNVVRTYCSQLPNIQYTKNVAKVYNPFSAQWAQGFSVLEDLGGMSAASLDELITGASGIDIDRKGKGPEEKRVRLDGGSSSTHEYSFGTPSFPKGDLPHKGQLPDKLVGEIDMKEASSSSSLKNESVNPNTVDLFTQITSDNS